MLNLRDYRSKVFALDLWIRSVFFFLRKALSRCYGRTTALRLLVQPYEEDE